MAFFYRFYIFLVFFTAFVTTAFTQPANESFRHLSAKDGLSHNSINCILQDRDGFLWFGTNDGLDKYDGHTFTVFQPNPAQPTHSFQGNQVMGLCEDRNGHIWAVTMNGGLHELIKETGQVIPHPIHVATHASWWNAQWSICMDHEGLLWISTYGGLARYNPTTHHFSLFPSPETELPLRSVFEDRQHRLWVGSLRGLYVFDRKTARYSLVPLNQPTDHQPFFVAFFADRNDTLWLGTVGDGLFRINLRDPALRLTPYNPGGQINRYIFLNGIQQDRNGYVLVGTNNGLQRINPKTDQVTTCRADPEKQGCLSSNNAQAVFLDRSGTLWVGTDNGIDWQSATPKQFNAFRVTPNSGEVHMLENRVNTVIQDDQATVWFSNFNKVHQLDLRQNRLTSLDPSRLGTRGTYTNYVCSLLPDGPSGVWLGTWDALYRYDNRSGRLTTYPSEIPAQFISRSPTGQIWFGGEGGLASFDPRTEQFTFFKYRPGDVRLLDKYVYGILASRTGDVWVSINGKGVSRLSPKTGRYQHYLASRRPGQLNDNVVLTFYEDANHIIWLGTNQGGLNRFDPKTNTFSQFTTQDGLPSNNIVGIVGDNAGRLWLSTNRGLCRFDPRTKVIRNYDVNDGLPSNDFLPGAVFRKGNVLYFGSLNGFVHFDPAAIRDNTQPFPVHITGFKVLDKTVPVTSRHIDLNHDENFLSFEFVALTYGMPERNQYTFRLENVDKNWVKSGNRRFASYTDLPPGNYTFRVKAANSDGIWNQEGTALQLTIHPPWWASWWAYGLYALLFAGGIFGLVRAYTNRLKERQEMELQRRESEQLKQIDELKTRFFSNITHELRTPLSLIISPVEQLAQNTTVPEPVRRQLTVVERNAQKLLRLINQLLDLSKLEAGRMDLDEARGDVAGFVEQLIDSFRPAVERKGITLTFINRYPNRNEALFDADKWEKILYNLLSNAFKFTSAPGLIQVELWESADQQVSIRVSDTGIGIPAQAQPRIFERFYQVDDSRTRSYEGTGIGLSLVKELIDILGGTIQMTSQDSPTAVDRGTTFTLTLPIRQTEAETIDATSVKAATDFIKPVSSDAPVLTTAGLADETAPLILIVEDSDDLREFVANELSRDYRVLTAANGRAGWEIARQELPDVIITDQMMPEMDGLALTRQLKTDPTTNHIAVVMLTARASQQSRLDGLEQGADDYMSKPFNLDELRLRLRNLLDRQRKLQERYQQQLTSVDTPLKVDQIEDSFLKEIYQHIEERLDDSQLTVENLALMSSMSRRTLHRKLTALTNLSANDIIRNYRLRRATDFLRAGHSVSDTAYRVGFDNPAYFTTVFKQVYQRTPSDFIGK
ncbi:hybrid sensor histidine kinase/response regulator [Fibrisoma montanum]|uniref:histidine kinase n=1 Tax=Fibrisoma montanum TaxID=2305895 RepID=A0A418MH68_9BACT|nr:hybrid sensor histidine kinase/response regulator transcription factor [Fibrisoma montanum]RIV26754.1 hybrid sensor histidine kinase/response regulator [Fibrisoma montanum]